MPPWAPPALAPAPPAPLNIFNIIRDLMESPPAPLRSMKGRMLFIPPPRSPPGPEAVLARLKRWSNILFLAFWAAAVEASAGWDPAAGAAANYRRKKKVLSAKARQHVHNDLFSSNEYQKYEKKIEFLFFSLIYLSVSNDFFSNKIFVDCWDKINKSNKTEIWWNE